MLEFKSATTNDIEQIQQLASQVWEYTYDKILEPDQLKYMFDKMYSITSLQKQLEIDHHHYFIISENETPHGYLSIEKVNEHFFIFQKVYVIPSAHGKGVGRFMIEQGCKYLKENYSCPVTIELFVNRHNPAYEFYQHMGFYKYGSRDEPIGNDYYMNDYIMRMELQ